MIKLIVILSGGLIVLVGGAIFQHRVLLKKDNNTEVNDELDENSQIAKYIKQYKDSYSRDSIKKVLIENGGSEEEIERYLSKFF